MRALVISGGGSKGAFEGGVAQFLFVRLHAFGVVSRTNPAACAELVSASCGI